MWKSEAVLTAALKSSPRDGIIEAQMVKLTGFTEKQVGDCCRLLVRRGLMAKTDRGCYTFTEAGRAALEQGVKLHSGPNEPHIGRYVRRNTLRERAWRAMRVKRKFTVSDIALLVVQGGERDVERNIGKYLKALQRAGYVQKLPVREPGRALTSNGYVRWSLIVDNGPLPPVWRQAHGTLYDPNLEVDIRLAEAGG